MSSTAVAVTKNATLMKKFADKFGVDQGEVGNILKATAFKVRDGVVSDDQMAALMIVANEYGLNPFVKEIYAYPDKQNGIVPVVGVDGWSRIINEHPQMDGIEFRYSEATIQHKGKVAFEWVECIIHRKDRAKPTVVREYFDEVVRSVNFTTPWDTHPKRMHRHKTEIQCARIAFGFSGIYDEDEAARITEIDVTPGQPAAATPAEPAARPILDEATFKLISDKYKQSVVDGKKTVADFIAWVENKGADMTVDQKNEVNSWVKPAPTTVEGEATKVDDSFVTEMEEAESEVTNA
jgi:phage recombination protein Bet